ncbi:hypothetical protein DFP78_110149 [Photobacterium lutimaris]|nr:hypothetical protein DFP78_110149 [Photobacterium lutimaris]
MSLFVQDSATEHKNEQALTVFNVIRPTLSGANLLIAINHRYYHCQH